VITFTSFSSEVSHGVCVCVCDELIIYTIKSEIFNRQTSGLYMQFQSKM
jgi:hypothetical protein